MSILSSSPLIFLLSLIASIHAADPAKVHVPRQFNGGGILTIFLATLVFVAVGLVGYRVAPKSADQLVWRICIILTLVCMWMMWSITYLAQLNQAGMFAPIHNVHSESDD